MILNQRPKNNRDILSRIFKEFKNIKTSYMINIFKIDRSKVISQEIDGIVHRLTSGDYNDQELSEIILAVKNRSLNYLKERRKSLSDDLENNIESIKNLE